MLRPPTLNANPLFKFLWTPAETTKPEPNVYHFAPQSTTFAEYYDRVQVQLETLTSMTNLLSSIYNKIIIL